MSLTVQALPHLPLAQFRFEFNTLDDFYLSGYPGLAWRGGVRLVTPLKKRFALLEIPLVTFVC